MVSTAIVCFLRAQSSMLDQIPQLGHIPKIFKAMNARNDAIPKSALLIISELANNKVCVIN